MAEPPEAEILEALTNEGDIPLTYCFVHAGGVHYWNPHLRCVMHKVFRTDAFALACVRYLRARGLSEDGADFAALAAHHDWKGWGQPPPNPFE
jgi:hypothetical protein